LQKTTAVHGISFHGKSPGLGVERLLPSMGS
jgi:hypothetical protein